MFTLQCTFGQHNIYRYDTKKHPFRQFLENLYETTDLENIHKQSKQFQDFKNGKILDISDLETDIHKKFYSKIKILAGDRRENKQNGSAIRKVALEDDAGGQGGAPSQ